MINAAFAGEERHAPPAPQETPNSEEVAAANIAANATRLTHVSHYHTQVVGEAGQVVTVNHALSI